MPAYYNEIDPYAAQWLRNLIAAGIIAPGDVDERSIADVRAGDLAGYEQCHFFAGIGGWSYALRLAGWPDDRPVWTGSCPCQPFSAAGAGKAADDERHLWPRWFPLIAERRPAIVFGEQVEAAIGWGWLDLVFADLEGEGYACGAAVLPACGIGAPHIRNRCWFVADAHSERHESQLGGVARAYPAARPEPLLGIGQPQRSCPTGELADANGRNPSAERLQRSREYGQRAEDGRADRLADTLPTGRPQGRPGAGNGQIAGSGLAGGVGIADRDGWLAGCETAAPNGHRHSAIATGWDADWLPCTDGKARPVEPVSQQMADGLPESLGRLRPDQISEVEREIIGATDSDGVVREAVHGLWGALRAEAVRQRPARRPDGVHEPRFLLAFLRQLTEQGWAFAESVSCARQETEEAELRGVRRDDATARASCGRGLDEQRSSEHPDALRLLSSILARHAQAAWGEAFDANARARFPLAHGIPGRVGRLRAYGNAIVPQVAAEFVRAYMNLSTATAPDDTGELPNTDATQENGIRGGR